MVGQQMDVAMTQVPLPGNAVAAVHEWSTAGAPTRGTCVFLHATGFHSRCWDAVVADLQANGCLSNGPGPRCLGIDLRGHGRSSKPWPPSALRDPWADAAADVAVVLQKLRVRDAVLVGHSAGGWVAASVAAAEAQAHRSDDAAPRAVGGMVLLDPVIQEATAYEQHAVLSADAERAHNAQRYGGIEKRFNGFASAEAMQVRKRVFLRHFMLKTIILPRQARDIHRKTHQKRRVDAGAIHWERPLRRLGG